MTFSLEKTEVPFAGSTVAVAMIVSPVARVELPGRVTESVCCAGKAPTVVTLPVTWNTRSMGLVEESRR